MSDPPGRRKALPFLLMAVVVAVVLGIPSARQVSAQAKSSETAVEAQKRAWDDSLPGPRQPIPFSHAIHASQYQIQCLYCHTGTDRSRMAGVPSVENCMGCHSQFGGDLEGVQILKKYWEEKKPIEWQQIHRLPEHVKFRHNRHIQAGLACQTCHGPVQEMNKVYLVPDRGWMNGLPVAKLEMGWCINCHNKNQASIDCLTCHH